MREILFGTLFRELERKLAKVDSHLAAESEELRKEIRRRLGVLEGHVRRESEALSARLESERAAHAEALAAAARESRETVLSLEHRVAKLEEALARAQRELRQQILDQAKAFLDETQKTRDEVAAAMEREFAGLVDPGEADGPSNSHFIRALEAGPSASDH